MSAERSDFLEALITHEAAVGRLYQVFAEVFPTRERFWRALAAEEQGHADRLGVLGSDPTINGWLLRESGLRLQVVRSSIGYIESQMERAREGRLNLLQALSIARDLENALIEDQFSRMSGSPHVAATPILTRLAGETDGHRRMLAEAIEAERRALS
ncbi:MAG: hypothetical protein LLG45_03975 [Actinomycetia bacterium]|nr:hypothetical protein [Actinomycetes bacterium]